MSKKTPEQAAEEYANEVVRHDIDSLRYAMKEPVKIARADFLAGRKHFIEHELREYLEMARDGGYMGGLESFMFTFDNDDIINKALED